MKMYIHITNYVRLLRILFQFYKTSVLQQDLLNIYSKLDVKLSLSQVIDIMHTVNASFENFHHNVSV